MFNYIKSKWNNTEAIYLGVTKLLLVIGIIMIPVTYTLLYLYEKNLWVSAVIPSVLIVSGMGIVFSGMYKKAEHYSF